MEVIAARHYLARIVELCCQILSSLKIINYTYDLRVMVQLPAVDMKLSGPHHPLAVAELFMETAAPSPALAIQALTRTTLTANGPSSLLPEDLSLSGFILSALTTPETVSRIISSSMMDQMLILHPLDHIAVLTLT